MPTGGSGRTREARFQWQRALIFEPEPDAAAVRSRASCANGLRGWPTASRAEAAVRERAPAKLNLDLLVTGRRADGYHELDSLVVFADLGDELTCQPADGLSLEITGPFAARAAARSEDNLVLRAARLLAGGRGAASARAHPAGQAVAGGGRHRRRLGRRRSGAARPATPVGYDP